VPSYDDALSLPNTSTYGNRTAIFIIKRLGATNY
jgi:hypothetical protein